MSDWIDDDDEPSDDVISSSSCFCFFCFLLQESGICSSKPMLIVRGIWFSYFNGIWKSSSSQFTCFFGFFFGGSFSYCLYFIGNLN